MALLPDQERELFGSDWLPTIQSNYIKIPITYGPLSSLDGVYCNFNPSNYTQEELANMKAYLALKVPNSGSDQVSAISVVLGTDEVNAIEGNQLSGTWYLVEVQEVGTAIVAKKPALPTIEAGTAHEDEE